MNVRTCFAYISLSLILSACVTEPTVSYQLDVDPIFKERCIQCHVSPDGVGYRSTGLSMASYETLMRGTIYGPVVVPGDSKRSVLNKMVEKRAGNYMRMPHNKKDSLTDKEIKTLRLWVNQHAKNN